MIRRPPRSTLDRSSAASDVYKRQHVLGPLLVLAGQRVLGEGVDGDRGQRQGVHVVGPVSYTHLRAHETVLDLVCRLLLEKKNTQYNKHRTSDQIAQQKPRR